MTDFRISALFGVAVIRPGFCLEEMKPGALLEYTGEPPIILPRPVLTINCRNCGAPPEPVCSYCGTIHD